MLNIDTITNTVTIHNKILILARKIINNKQNTALSRALLTYHKNRVRYNTVRYNTGYHKAHVSMTTYTTSLLTIADTFAHLYRQLHNH